jgi:hypothetical protein
MANKKEYFFVTYSGKAYSAASGLAAAHAPQLAMQPAAKLR